VMLVVAEAVGRLLVQVCENVLEGVGVLLRLLLTGLMDAVKVRVVEAEVLQEDVKLLVSLHDGACVSDMLWLGLGGVAVADTEVGVGRLLLALQDPEGEAVVVTVSKRDLV